MHKILFRGKPKNELIDWVYGYYFYSELTCKHYIMGESKDYGYNCIEVIPETVGQYTELNDKNGTKIFEGDIVRVSRGKDIETGEIQYNKYGVWVIVYDKFYCNTFPYIFTSSDSNVWIKVIGNIHDNPELLNAEDGL